MGKTPRQIPPVPPPPPGAAGAGAPGSDDGPYEGQYDGLNEPIGPSILGKAEDGLPPAPAGATGHVAPGEYISPIDADGDPTTPNERVPGELRPQQYPCRRCGAAVVFTPGTNDLTCPYCGTANAIAVAEAAIHELDFREHLELVRDQAGVVDRIVERCTSCAAEVTFPDDVVSHRCPFCSEAIVATSESAKLIKPGSLLPFKIDRGGALAFYKKWLSSRWFVPNDLKRSSRVEGRFQGVYLPYWTYDAIADTAYTGARGEHYYVTVSYTDSNGNRRSRQERRTRWYPASGRVRDVFDDVLVPATKSLAQDELDKLEPWDLPELVTYDDAYLAGMRAESYAVDLPAGFGIACVKMEPTIRSTIRRDIGGDEQRIHSMQTAHSNITFKHVLLPVWLATYRYKRKLYRIKINARTGEVWGERPYSWIKITLLVLAILAVVGAIVAGIMLTR